MNKDLHRLIASASEMGAARALHALGLTAGEMSQRQAVKTYGKWLADAIATGRIAPSRQETGHAGTKFFRVVDILALQTEYSAEAYILNSHTL